MSSHNLVYSNMSTSNTDSRSVVSRDPLDDKPVTMWYLECPFRKSGSPVMGNVGTSVRHVIVFEYDEWLRFAKLHPTIETQQFNVGTLE